MTTSWRGLPAAAALVGALVLPSGSATVAPAASPVWVLLATKPNGSGGQLSWHAAGFVPTAGQLAAPIDESAVATLTAGGFAVRQRSRWLNAVSGVASEACLEWVRRQPFVYRVQPVGRLRHPRQVGPAAASRAAVDVDERLTDSQLAQVRVHELHNRGVDGHGVLVALLDNGYHYRQHPALTAVEVVAARDFVNGDDTVTDESGQPVTGDETRSSQNLHGAQVMSVVAGRDADRFLGVAPGARLLLAKTEDNGAEMPVEEDRWVAGLEWADSLGARIASTSLGYNRWDDGTGYVYADLDGATALTSVAAAAAVRRGMVVVVAAGNEGDNEWRHVTAPADAPGVIAVGSVGVVSPADTVAPALAASSSRGPTADGRIKPDVVAPGQGVWAAEVRGGGYVRVYGTSFAAPMVAGVCALLLQVHPGWSPDEVLAALRTTARDLGPEGPDNDFGWGQVDALAASGLAAQVPQTSFAPAAYPNPVAADRIHFPFALARAARVELCVFTAAGALVYRTEWERSAGEYLQAEAAPVWDLSATEAQRHSRLANGVYLYRLSCDWFCRRGAFALVRGGRALP